MTREETMRMVADRLGIEPPRPPEHFTKEQQHGQDLPFGARFGIAAGTVAGSVCMGLRSLVPPCVRKSHNNVTWGLKFGFYHARLQHAAKAHEARQQMVAKERELQTEVEEAAGVQPKSKPKTTRRRPAPARA